jgi:hypothetical protein
MEKRPPLSSSEQELIDVCSDFDDFDLDDKRRGKTEKWERIPNTILHHVEYFRKRASADSLSEQSSIRRGSSFQGLTVPPSSANRHRFWGRATVNVDAPATHVLGWLRMFMSYERIRRHLNNEGTVMRKQVDVEGRRAFITANASSMPPG